MLAPGAFPTVRYSAFCGEPLPEASVKSWQQACPNSEIDNIYGPTGATIACMGLRCSEPLTVTRERGTIAIGKAFSGMEAGIVDSGLEFLRSGEKGKLAVSGKQIAKGYFADAQMTEARFPKIDGNVWYLTGDLAYKDANGIFHHLGRTDHQVKVLGFRVEIEDIECHLREACAVDSVAAVAWPNANGSAEGIVAFVAGSELTAQEIRDAMQHRVPKYMIPTQVRVLERLPLSASGKIDRKALAAMLSDSSA